MPKISYSTTTGSQEEAQGDDGRINTSSRTSSRLHYVSRDDGESYSLVSNDATAAAGTYIIYWSNTDGVGRRLFIDSITMSGVETALWKVHYVTGTAAAGSSLTPINLNNTSSNAAPAIARGDDSITGLTVSKTIFTGRSSANGPPLKFDTKDAVMLGQNQAIAVEYDTGVTGVAEVTIVGYYEA